LYGQHY